MNAVLALTSCRKKGARKKKTQPTRNANFAKFSRENLAQIGLQKCLLRYGENMILWKKKSLRARFPVRWDVFVAPGHVKNMLSINGACVDSHKLQKRQRQFPLALASTTSISYVSHQATHNWKF